MHLRQRPSPLQPLLHPAVAAAGIQAYVKREDLYTLRAGTALQGNKVRKLEPVLKAALVEVRRPVLVSFGGAYSNHVAALATAGKLYELPVHLIIRGEEVDNPLLQYCAAAGARLSRISRSEYRRRSDQHWLADLKRRIARQERTEVDRIWLIPEGGTTERGVANVGALYGEIVNQLGKQPDYLAVSAGTGGTAAGLIRAAGAGTHVEVFPALKGNWMRTEIDKWLVPGDPGNWTCITDYSFGGYGKFPPEWRAPSAGLATRADIGEGQLPPLEPIYTAKLFAGVLERIRRGAYPAGASLVVIHTGGIY